MAASDLCLNKFCYEEIVSSFYEEILKKFKKVLVFTTFKVLKIEKNIPLPTQSNPSDTVSHALRTTSRLL